MSSTKANNDSRVLKYLAGSPLFLGEAVCAIYPPTLREIVDVGYDTFIEYLNVISLDKPIAKKGQSDEFLSVVSELSIFEYFVFLTQIDATMNKLIRETLHFFLHENVSFSLEPCCQILVGKMDEKRIIDETLFMEMRDIIRQCCWLTDADSINTTPQEDDSDFVRALREQMRVNHEKLARAKRVDKNGDRVELSDLIASLTVGNCGLNIFNIWDITYYAFHDQLKRMGWHEQFDINNRAAMAGAKMKKQDLKHWIKPIQSK